MSLVRSVERSDVRKIIDGLERLNPDARINLFGRWKTLKCSTCPQSSTVRFEAFSLRGGLMHEISSPFLRRVHSPAPLTF